MSNHSKKEDTVVSEVLAASLGGAISAGVLYPLEVLKTKMQAEGNNSNDDDDDQDKKPKAKQVSMIQYAYNMYQKEGASVFFRGYEVSAFQSATEKALYFFAYTLLKDLHNSFLWKKRGESIPTMNNLVLGCMAEWAHLPITLPLDCWTTQICTKNDTSSSDGGGGPKNSNLQLLLLLLQKGPSTWYKGISAYYILCLKPAIQYTVYEQIKNLLILRKRAANANNRGHSSKNQSENLSALESFLLGMIARTIATMITFPWIRAKVLMQTSSKQDEEGQEDSNDTSSSMTSRKKNNSGGILLLLAKMYQKDGILSWYQGLGPELTRGVLSSALMLMIKEKISAIVKTIA